MAGPWPRRGGKRRSASERRGARTSLSILLTAVVIAGAAPPSPASAQELPWMEQTLPPAQRAELLIQAMTLDEKIQQIAMKPVPNTDLPECGFYAGARHVEGIPRLNIPTIRMTNGPIGVGGGDCSPDPQATGVPTELAVAASWDPSASYRWGDIAGSETRSNAHNVFLAPGVNLGRIPNNGRNFEYFGEDPYLAGVMASEQTRGVQRHGVQATAKHFAANEQETQRSTMNTIVDDRTLHELYLLPFEMSIKDAGLAAVMCSYPRINGTFACENRPLLTDVLRDQWGFEGYVMSDRGAPKSTVPAIKAGLDLEFASPRFFTPDTIKPALAAGQITVADLDGMLKPRYATMFRLGQFDHPVIGFTPIDFATHGAAARQLAEQGSVLLKNEGGVLPLDATKLRSVALIGPQTFAGEAKFPATGPGGFIKVNAPYTVTPEEGLRNTLAGLGSHATVTYHNGTDLAGAAALAARSDVAIVMAGDISLEGVDRANLDLPIQDGVDQEALISAVARVNPRTVVVLKNGGPIVMPWLSQVPSVLEAWYPGQEDGNAVANVLFGVVNPSGKLPITFPKAEREAAASTPEQFPGVDIDGTLTATYSEGLRMGYRWYDATNSAAQFPFGFGLSYTSFAISKLVVTPQTADGTEPIRVAFFVENTGKTAGAQVPQVYLGLPSATGEPPKRLVAFEKVWLNPGQKKLVELTIDPAASNHPLSIWDSGRRQWTVTDGEYQVYVGDSSTNIVLSDSITVRTPPGRQP
ncbi:glycosyl hydrolase [Micromonospora globispora]|uniref:Glycosyl hydrolase n=2 Tax=Micromonospora globispora TaxID=1450148 RepID=A0A317K5Q0_9ACTN|nr:glycosyl hydrolase [Micromonospora globispora]PWU55152.1 glycosyl hydrolase [Micromonospora globispora]